VHLSFEQVRFARVAGKKYEALNVLTSKDIEPKAVTKHDGDALDLIGITVGMPIPEAETVISEHLGSFEKLVSQPNFGPETPPFQDVLFYVRSDKQERIALFIEKDGNEPTVLAIERVVGAPDWAISQNDMIESAIAKYGEPYVSEVAEFETIMAWGKNLGQKQSDGYVDRSQCKLSHSQNSVENWLKPDGSVVKGYEYFRGGSDIDMRHLPYLDYYLQPEFANFQQCGPLLNIRHNKSGFVMFLGDLKAYGKAYIDARAKRITDQKQRIEKIRNSKPKIKL
jgi:hypothetical protein